MFLHRLCLLVPGPRSIQQTIASHLGRAFLKPRLLCLDRLSKSIDGQPEST